MQNSLSVRVRLYTGYFVVVFFFFLSGLRFEVSFGQGKRLLCQISIQKLVYFIILSKKISNGIDHSVYALALLTFWVKYFCFSFQKHTDFS